MKITDVRVQAIDVGQGFCWGNRRDMQVIGVLVTLQSDTGHVGHGLAWTAELPAASVISAIDIGVKPHLLGGDPFNRHQLLAPVWRGFRVGTPLPAIGVVDVALWDLAGKACGRSVTEMLGRRHDRLKGCASAPPVASADECADMIKELMAAGFNAVKLHSCGDVNIDIAACHAARSAGGDGLDLMMDAMAIYRRDEILRLGRALDECAFVWFEDPLPDDDLDGWIDLRGRIDTPLAGVDAVRFTIKDYARPMADGAFDIVRMEAARDGISELDALGKLADGFGLGCEGHAFGPALAQSANLQVALACAGARYCELPVPLGALDFGVAKGLTLDAEGFVAGPQGPGLGLEVDRSAMDAAALR
jgi:L-alanine-DL-glutamate epimerase-like enolase superfamily enzyme